MDANTMRQRALETAISELERSLAAMKTNRQSAISNLQLLRESIEKDDLTRLLRRNAFIVKLQDLLKSSRAVHRPVHLMMIDLDHFKRVNDLHGHQTGDVVLMRVSELIRSFLRPFDLAGRYGGEEIIVAIQGSAFGNEREALGIAEKMRAAVESRAMVSTANAEFTVTLSVGIASTQKFGYEADDLISHADKALYRAKNSGRNKVVGAGEPADAAAVLEFAIARAAA